MVFDALVGETDRHAENWGITKRKTKYKLSPLYDNGTNLLRNFKNEKYVEKYYNKEKSLDAYIKKATSLLFKEDHSKHYKLDELIEYLYLKYPIQVTKEIKNLKKLTPNKINRIVNKIPDELLTTKHKEAIIYYLNERKKLLENIINKGRQ